MAKEVPLLRTHTHGSDLVNGRYGEELRDLDQPLKIEHDWNLTSKMASFETLIITCKSEHSTRE